MSHIIGILNVKVDVIRGKCVQKSDGGSKVLTVGPNVDCQVESVVYICSGGAPGSAMI